MMYLLSSSSSSSDEEEVIPRRKVYRERVDNVNRWNDVDVLGVQNSAESDQRHSIIASTVYKNACDVMEMTRTAEQFYAIARFPRVVGTIDCTHVRIQSPGGDDAEIYRNRKGYFSINVQTVSDAKLRIRNIVARWPGSVHDQTIFNNSTLKRDFDAARYENFMLIGDSGYSIRQYLMTPLQHVATAAENLYNESLIRTRNTVERQYGVWKRRFPILSSGMRVKVETAMAIIVATAVLHNKAIDMNDDLPEEPNVDVNNADDEQLPGHQQQGGGNLTRQLLINEHFARL